MSGRKEMLRVLRGPNDTNPIKYWGKKKKNFLKVKPLKHKGYIPGF